MLKENSQVKVAVLVSGGGTNLQAILDQQESGKLKHGKVSVVISSNPNAYALERAKKHGVKGVVVARKGVSFEEFEQGIVDAIESEGAKVIVLAGFMSILSKNFTDKYKDRIINVHPSLIPSFCGEGFYGLKVHESALSYGVKVTGATVHFVNEIADGGKIILQKAVKIKKGDTPEILQRRVMEQAEWKILPKALDLVCKAVKKGEI